MTTESLQSQLQAVEVQIKSELDQAFERLESAKKALEAERAHVKQVQAARVAALKEIRNIMRTAKLTTKDLV